MTSKYRLTGGYATRRTLRAIRLAFVSSAVTVAAGCDAFNPAFIDIVDPGGSRSSLNNAPGHIVVGFVNNAVVDERLLAFLESAAGGSLDLTEAERAELRPRIRFRVRITFFDGSFQTIEFIDGSQNLIQPGFETTSVPDLNQNDLNNVVSICDVASVTLEPGSDIEVFIPTELTGFALVTAVDVAPSFEARVQIPPQFRALEVDEVDDDGNIVLRRNIGIRDVPTPANNPLCGSLIAITVDGSLAVPFHPAGNGAPSFDAEDPETIAQIGGRFEFRVSIQ